MTTIKSLRKYNEMIKKSLSWTFYSAELAETGVQDPKNGLRLSSIVWSKEEINNNLLEQPESVHQYSETSLAELWNGLNLICEGKEEKIDFSLNEKVKMTMTSEDLLTEQTDLGWKSEACYLFGSYENEMKDTTKFLVELQRNVVK